MKISFSTLGCPDWKLSEVIQLALSAGYDGIELRFLEGEDSLWKLPEFKGQALFQARRSLADAGLVVSCVDTSCRFDSPNDVERQNWIAEGERIAELAAELQAPGIRVFGDRIQPGQDREATRNWIAESLNTLRDKIAPTGVAVWLETHGDFSSSSELVNLLTQSAGVGLVWDPAAAFIEAGERPVESGATLKTFIRHIHIKDLARTTGWFPVLTGQGQFPLAEMKSALQQMNYEGFLSFEWEKKWYPAVEDPKTAIPHFANWFRSEWQEIQTEKTSSISRTGAPS
jgi:sugar phosphate isomerase/epimerase